MSKPSTPITSQFLGALLKSARDTMRKDKGLNGDLGSGFRQDTKMEGQELTEKIIGCAMKVHSTLGPPHWDLLAYRLGAPGVGTLPAT